MIWLIGLLALLGVTLVVLGNRATNEPGQSADVRMGGLIPFFIGAVLLLIDAVLLLIWLVVKAVN